ncbi:MAG: hypothetical protein S4CHLAM45_05350 [Chlamydiales bacterium]|nr:hypothetical protein [Chlamydiales bacterium]MCH9619924.1 hypothetical protein [Chlamydiales bacterium]MCH9622649.1 hypothetical protein [Chlamydiales bacterium]
MSISRNSSGSQINHPITHDPRGLPWEGSQRLQFAQVLIAVVAESMEKKASEKAANAKLDKNS